jgi:hypothetical protein
MRHSSAASVLAVFLATACGGPAERSAESGHLEAHWIGPDTGQLSAPASAEWCPQGRRLEIRAINGDTGFAIVLYPLDTIDADTYRVVPPAGADSLAPSAAIALRFFLTTAIKGYQGDSGTVVLKRSGSGELSGTVAARSRSVLNTQALEIAGDFEGLVVSPQTRGCSPESLVDTAESLVDSAEPLADSTDANAETPAPELD